MPKKKNNNIRIFSTSIPEELESELTFRYKNVISRYRSGDLEHHETSVGKFCEVVLRIFEYILNGSYTPIGAPNRNLQNVIDKIIKDGSDMSMRKRIAPLVRVLISFRNERDAAHIGGFNLGIIDGNVTFYATRWIYAELIRIYSDTSNSQIQKKIDEGAKIEFPDLMRVGRRKIITNPRMTSEKEVLLSLEDGEKTFKELYEMNKEQNKTRFKRKLHDMEKGKLIFYKNETSRYTILPEGKKAGTNDI